MRFQSATAMAVLLVLFSCNTKQEKIPHLVPPKIVEAHGYVVPKDSMAKPRVVPAGKPRIVSAGKPKVVHIKSNIHPAGIPRVVVAGAPKICTPGKNGFSLPRIVSAIDNPLMAGLPEVVMAKEAHTRDQNPHNFTSLGKLQGLNSDFITCLLEDKSGNLWMGGMGGGASRYNGKSFTHLTAKNGLRNNYLWSILEDKAGNIWFGKVLGGVSKYDGEHFTHFTAKEGLTNYGVVSMLEDRNGHIWFGTSGGGVIKYDGTSFYHFTEKEGLSQDNVRTIAEDKHGNLWFGTLRGGVSKYDGKTFTHFTVKEGVRNNVTSILQDKSGNLWFGTDHGLIRYDTTIFTQFTDSTGLSGNNVWCLLQDKSGNIWIGTSDGVSKYDGKSFTHFTEKEGLRNNHVRTIIEDKHGNLWFGTEGGGVNKYSGKMFTQFTAKEGLNDVDIRSVLEDKYGNLWFSTWNGGVSKYDGRSFTHFTEKEGLHSNSIRCMLEDKSGNLWFANYYGVSKYDGKTFSFFTEKEGLSNADIFSMLEDKHGNIWLGTFWGGVNKYDGKTFTHFTEKEGLLGNFVISIQEDKSGDLWFGNSGRGINKFDGRSITHFTKSGGLIDNEIRSMLADKNGNLWIGSAASGVSKYDGKTFTHFTEKEGLSNANVGSIYEDKHGNFWFGTFFGLSKLENEHLHSFSNIAANDRKPHRENHKPLFRSYTYEDGFLGLEINFGKTICEARDGKIWIGTADRLTVYHPGEERPDTTIPNIQLTALTLFNETISWQNFMSHQESGIHPWALKDTNVVLPNGVIVKDVYFNDLSKWYRVPQNLSLAYNNNYLTFHFVGITLQSPKKVKYQYKLEGLDQNWSALTNRSEVAYGNLPHGRYTFKVKAMNGDGYWSSEIHYPFTIRPPWWQTWWAYTLFTLLFTTFIYALFRYRINKIRMEHEIVVQQHKTAELEMQALRAQMNPHFIFNSLNAINMFILENNKLQASEYLSKFSRLVRLILQNSQEALIPLEREIEALQLYLELESLRFEHRFKYTIAVADDVDTATLKVPPLVIQPYAENAIWHGLMHKKENGHLDIEVYQEGKVLVCKVTDDGIGRNKAAALKSKSSLTHKSMGMRVTANRIQMLHQENQNDTSILIKDLVLPDGTSGGTEVLIRIPVCYD